MTATQAPGRVTEAASRRGLGELLIARKTLNPVLMIGLAVVAVGLAVAAIAALNALDMRVPTLRIAAIAVFVAAPFFILYVVLVGFRSSYLFDRGLVFAKNWTAKAVAWNDVRNLEVKRTPATDESGSEKAEFVLHLHDGGTVSIDDGADGFGDRLVERVQAAGLQVTR